ncbi:MAG: hypothetical protein NXH96_00695 [Alteromonadaceae bacterium]|nr:hypothetical protein [Alteromonadaceae bacterium]
MSQSFWRQIAKAFGLSGQEWQKHANPMSVWTRFTVLPLFILAVWSREWFGWWSLVLIALVVVWAWVNPRLFNPPSSKDNWASMAVLGEQIWLENSSSALIGHHRIVPLLLSIVAGFGVPFLGWGLWHLDVWPTMVGTILIYSGKVWFLDRMVWLYCEHHQTALRDT